MALKGARFRSSTRRYGCHSPASGFGRATGGKRALWWAGAATTLPRTLGLPGVAVHQPVPDDASLPDDFSVAPESHSWLAEEAEDDVDEDGEDEAEDEHGGEGEEEGKAFAFDGDVAGQAAEEGDLTKQDQEDAGGEEQAARDDEEAAEAADVETDVHSSMVELGRLWAEAHV